MSHERRRSHVVSGMECYRYCRLCAGDTDMEYVMSMFVRVDTPTGRVDCGPFEHDPIAEFSVNEAGALIVSRVRIDEDVYSVPAMTFAPGQWFCATVMQNEHP